MISTSHLVNLRYDLQAADCCGIHDHPQAQMKKLGITVTKSEPVSVADCWWFRADLRPQQMPLPEYLDFLPDSFRFSDERIPLRA